MLKAGVLHKHFNRVNLALSGSEASLSSTRCRQLPEVDEFFVKRNSKIWDLINVFWQVLYGLHL